MFIGMRASATPANAEPSTLTNFIGVGHGDSDTNMKLFWGSSAQTPIDLGANFPLDRSTTPYELALFAPPNETAVYWQVTNLNTSDTATGKLTGAAAVLRRRLRCSRRGGSAPTTPPPSPLARM